MLNISQSIWSQTVIDPYPIRWCSDQVKRLPCATQHPRPYKHLLCRGCLVILLLAFMELKKQVSTITGTHLLVVKLTVSMHRQEDELQGVCDSCIALIRCKENCIFCSKLRKIESNMKQIAPALFMNSNKVVVIVPLGQTPPHCEMCSLCYLSTVHSSLFVCIDFVLPSNYWQRNDLTYVISSLTLG